MVPVGGAGSRRIGIQYWEPRVVVNDGGMMPITVWGLPSNSAVRPMSAESAANMRRQSWSLSTTTAGPPGRSSSAVKARPRAGLTAITVK